MKLIDAYRDITVQHVSSVRQIIHLSTLPTSPDRDGALARHHECIPRYQVFLSTAYTHMLAYGSDAPLGALETEFYDLAWTD